VNFILIVSDTFRRDHCPGYGNERIIAPNLKAFADSGLVFEDCYPSSFPTLPARADLMTGRYTFPHLDWGPLPQHETTLAQCLTKAGYLTCGIVDTPFYLRNGYGYDRGFQDFKWIQGQKGGQELADVVLQARGEGDLFAPRTLKTAADWLERHYKEKFFLLVDTWDPHEPWDPPAYYVKPYFLEYKGEVVSPAYWEWRENGTTERELEIAHACYCGEISMVDRWFGFLMERVRTMGLLENTVIIFVSDHGFYFGEHGLFGKRRFRWADKVGFEEGFNLGRTLADGYTFRSPLHNEITQVPLLMRMPGETPRRIPGLVTLPDLMPTLLDLAGAEIPKGVQAKSMTPLIRRDVERLHDIVVTSAPFEAAGDLTKTVDDMGRETVETSPSSITDGEWDLLYAEEGGQVELYRTVEDAGHERNVIEEHPDVARALHGKFVEFLERVGTAESKLERRRRL
jgi:arylsulfatase A-like enzyme